MGPFENGRPTRADANGETGLWSGEGARAWLVDS